MTEDATDAGRPRKLTLWRKLAVVAGLMVFGVVATWSLALSNRRPSLREVHVHIEAHLKRTNDPINVSRVSTVLGEPSYLVTSELENGVAWFRKIATWYHYDWLARQYTALDLTINHDGTVARSRCERIEMGPVDFVVYERILPFCESTWQSLRFWTWRRP